MKKITALFLLIIGFVLFTTVQVFAQTPASSTGEVKAASVNAEEKQIQDLKEKIATKVAELREKNNKAIAGTVTSNDGNIIKIKTQDDRSYDIKIDDALTNFYQIVGASKKEIKRSNIEKGNYIIVTGVVTDQTITANIVYVDELYLVNSGKITEVNKNEYYIKVLTTEKDNYTLDIETYTKQQMLNIKTLVPETMGFSKFKEGDTIHFVVKKTGMEKELNRYSAQKILLIPQEFFIK